MENKATPMKIGDENFAKLMKEVTDVFRKHNPPLEVAITGIFYVVAEVAQRNRISKEALQSALSEVYDNVANMLAKESETQNEPTNEVQH
jgi:uncharacterized protein YejL (UPF0352 family)